MSETNHFFELTTRIIQEKAHTLDTKKLEV